MRALARAAGALAVGAALLGEPAALRGGAAVSPAHAEEEWFAEFEAICAQTQDAMTLPDDALRALVARCDRLRPRIEALEPSRRKVWSKRLQQCRDLYQFVLDSRANQG